MRQKKGGRGPATHINLVLQVQAYICIYAYRHAFAFQQGLSIVHLGIPSGVADGTKPN